MIFASDAPEQGGVYRHFKGDGYTVIGVATAADDCEPVVVYVSLNSGRWWTRKLADWMAPKTFDDGSRLKRFERVG